MDFLPKLIVNERRDFLKKSVVAAMALPIITSLAEASEEPIQLFKKERELKIERFGKIYNIPFEDKYGRTIKDGYDMLCRVFGDFKANEAIHMDIELFRVLSRGQEWLEEKGYNKPLILTSGYRTIWTNRHTEGAALHSLHPEGKASDVKLKGVSPNYVAQLFRSFGATGIGEYGTFTHLDTGRWRKWRG